MARIIGVLCVILFALLCEPVNAASQAKCSKGQCNSPSFCRRYLRNDSIPIPPVPAKNCGLKRRVVSSRCSCLLASITASSSSSSSPKPTITKPTTTTTPTTKTTTTTSTPSPSQSGSSVPSSTPTSTPTSTSTTTTTPTTTTSLDPTSTSAPPNNDLPNNSTTTSTSTSDDPLPDPTGPVTESDGPPSINFCLMPPCTSTSTTTDSSDSTTSTTTTTSTSISSDPTSASTSTTTSDSTSTSTTTSDSTSVSGPTDDSSTSSPTSTSSPDNTSTPTTTTSTSTSASTSASPSPNPSTSCSNSSTNLTCGVRGFPNLGSAPVPIFTTDYPVKSIAQCQAKCTADPACLSYLYLYDQQDNSDFADCTTLNVTLSQLQFVADSDSNQLGFDRCCTGILSPANSSTVSCPTANSALPNIGSTSYTNSSINSGSPFYVYSQADGSLAPFITFYKNLHNITFDLSDPSRLVLLEDDGQSATIDNTGITIGGFGGTGYCSQMFTPVPGLAQFFGTTASSNQVNTHSSASLTQFTPTAGSVEVVFMDLCGRELFSLAQKPTLLCRRVGDNFPVAGTTMALEPGFKSVFNGTCPYSDISGQQPTCSASFLNIFQAYPALASVINTAVPYFSTSNAATQQAAATSGLPANVFALKRMSDALKALLYVSNNVNSVSQSICQKRAQSQRLYEAFVQLPPTQYYQDGFTLSIGTLDPSRTPSSGYALTVEFFINFFNDDSPLIQTSLAAPNQTLCRYCLDYVRSQSSYQFPSSAYNNLKGASGPTIDASPLLWESQYWAGSSHPWTQPAYVSCCNDFRTFVNQTCPTSNNDPNQQCIRLNDPYDKLHTCSGHNADPIPSAIPRPTDLPPNGIGRA